MASSFISDPDQTLLDPVSKALGNSLRLYPDLDGLKTRTQPHWYDQTPMDPDPDGLRPQDFGTVLWIA